MKNQIELTQVPVIKHDLISIGANVSARIEELNIENQVATVDTISSMKKLRADLNKEAKDFEAQRKAVKDAVNSPYDEFNKVYQEEVITKYKSAVDTLKTKIGAFEAKIKDEKQKNIESYYAELCQSEKIDFVKFSQLNLKIDLSTSEKKYKEFCNEFIAKIQEDLKLISTEEHQAEMMAEFKTTLNASKAITTVRERKRKEKDEAERILMNRTSNREGMLRKIGLVYFDMAKAFALPSNDAISFKQSEIETFDDKLFKESLIILEVRIKEFHAKMEKLPTHPSRCSSDTPNLPNECAEIKKPLEAPKEVVKEEVFEAKFKVSASMAKLKALGAYMKSQEIKYENI